MTTQISKFSFSKVVLGLIGVYSYLKLFVSLQREGAEGKWWLKFWIFILKSCVGIYWSLSLPKIACIAKTKIQYNVSFKNQESTCKKLRTEANIEHNWKIMANKTKI